MKVDQASTNLIRQLPFLVISDFLYSKFSRVSACSNSQTPADRHSPTQNLAPLEAFSNPAHQSTPRHDHADPDEGGRVDLDGILHSFDKSASSLQITSLPPFGMSAFRVPQENDAVDITGDGTSGENIQLLTTTDDMGHSNPVPTTEIIAEEKSGLSPFSMYLNQTQNTPPVLQVQPPYGEGVQRQSVSLANAPGFATNSDLEALERRFQVLVSEATASFSSQLQGLIPPSPAAQTRDVLGSPRANAPETSSVAGTVRVREKRHPATRRVVRRERLAAEARHFASGMLTSPERPETAKRPKPRLHLNVQMFRKHPVFKFFVTAPMDSENNPHKWRCRVCQVELSLKTKGSLEILSHYRTESHLVREHRIRMETPGLPLYGRNELELAGLELDEAREKAQLEFPIAPTLGECYLLPGQHELPADIDSLDPSSVICSQIRILFIGLQHGGTMETLASLWSNLGLEVRGPAKVPHFDWSQERVFVSITFSSPFTIVLKYHIFYWCFLFTGNGGLHFP